MKLFLVATFISAELASAVDCTGYSEWVEQIYDNNPTSTVVYQSSLYTQKWYANPGDVPGVWGPWELLGACDNSPGPDPSPVNPTTPPPSPVNPTTTTTPPPSPNPTTTTTPKPVQPTTTTQPTPVDPSGGIDCSDYSAWVGSRTYANPGTKVSFQDNAWLSASWSQGSVPAAFQGSPWDYVGGCIPGSAPQADEGNKLSPEMAAALCTCCSGCAKLDGGTPLCVDGAGACWFTDCSGYNSYSEEKCKEFVDSGYFYQYTGTVDPPTSTTWPAKLYAPYVDMGLYPYPKLADVSSEVGTKFFNMAFVVTNQRTGVEECVGAWAGVIPLEQGPFSWNEQLGDNDYFYDELNKLRAIGGDIIVSFGGAVNIELADSLACRESGDPATNILNAYDHVVDLMKLTHIDFDIESAALHPTNRETGWAYRFQAVKMLKAKRPELHVWWTLPILPSGLTLEGTTFVEDMMNADAPWDLINVMTMDYGDSACPSLQMGDCEREAIDSLARQVYDAAVKTGKAASYGFNSVQDVYPKLGSTTMIGLNDVITEVYYPKDAEDSMNAWRTKPLGLVSNWSLTRDKPCPPGQGVHAAETTCNSLPDTVEFQFAKIYSAYNDY